MEAEKMRETLWLTERKMELKAPNAATGAPARPVGVAYYPWSLPEEYLPDPYGYCTPAPYVWYPPPHEAPSHVPSFLSAKNQRPPTPVPPPRGPSLCRYASEASILHSAAPSMEQQQRNPLTEAVTAAASKAEEEVEQDVSVQATAGDTATAAPSEAAAEDVEIQMPYTARDKADAHVMAGGDADGRTSNFWTNFERSATPPETPATVCYRESQWVPREQEAEDGEQNPSGAREFMESFAAEVPTWQQQEGRVPPPGPPSCWAASLRKQEEPARVRLEAEIEPQWRPLLKRPFPQMMRTIRGDFARRPTINKPHLPSPVGTPPPPPSQITAQQQAEGGTAGEQPKPQQQMDKTEELWLRYQQKHEEQQRMEYPPEEQQRWIDFVFEEVRKERLLQEQASEQQEQQPVASSQQQQPQQEEQSPPIQQQQQHSTEQRHMQQQETEEPFARSPGKLSAALAAWQQQLQQHEPEDATGHYSFGGYTYICSSPFQPPTATEEKVPEPQPKEPLSPHEEHSERIQELKSVVEYAERRAPTPCELMDQLYKLRDHQQHRAVRGLFEHMEKLLKRHLMHHNTQQDLLQACAEESRSREAREKELRHQLEKSLARQLRQSLEAERLQRTACWLQEQLDIRGSCSSEMRRSDEACPLDSHCSVGDSEGTSQIPDSFDTSPRSSRSNGSSTPLAQRLAQALGDRGSEGSEDADESSMSESESDVESEDAERSTQEESQTRETEESDIHDDNSLPGNPATPSNALLGQRQQPRPCHGVPQMTEVLHRVRAVAEGGRESMLIALERPHRREQETEAQGGRQGFLGGWMRQVLGSATAELWHRLASLRASSRDCPSGAETADFVAVSPVTYTPIDTPNARSEVDPEEPQENSLPDWVILAARLHGTDSTSTAFADRRNTAYDVTALLEAATVAAAAEDAEEARVPPAPLGRSLADSGILRPKPRTKGGDIEDFAVDPPDVLLLPNSSSRSSNGISYREPSRGIRAVAPSVLPLKSKQAFNGDFSSNSSNNNNGVQQQEANKEDADRARAPNVGLVESVTEDGTSSSSSQRTQQGEKTSLTPPESHQERQCLHEIQEHQPQRATAKTLLSRIRCGFALWSGQ